MPSIYHSKLELDGISTTRSKILKEGNMKAPKNIKNLSAKIDKLIIIGVKKIKYYYYKTPFVNNVFTCCLFLDENKSIISRGIAICSVLDTFNKRKGRGKSFSMALRAAIEKKNFAPIIISPDRWRQKTVTRKATVKNEKELEIYYNFTSKLIVNKNKGIKIIYKISRDYALLETNKIFKHRAMYKPDPVPEENFIFR